MNIYNPKKIDDLVVALLVKGTKNTGVLLEEVRQKRPKTTKQGFYSALRRLRKDEIVLVYKKHASLNTTWIERMQSFFETLAVKYKMGGGTLDVLSLADRESISYVFYSSEQVDIFWGHVQSILTKNLPVSEALYTYDPHYWFYIARPEVEKKIVAEVIAPGRQFLMTVAGDTTLDRFIKKDFTTDERQYAIEDFYGDNSYYVTVIGDFITEAFFDKEIVKKIEAIYAKNQAVLSSDDALLFKEILESHSKNRLKITRNHKKATELKKRLAKNFYVKHIPEK